jgi:hypothetical protein
MYASAIGDSITYFWDRYILTYGLGDQIALIAEMIGRAGQTMRSVRRATAQSMRMVASPIGAAILLSIPVLAVAGLLIARRRQPLFGLLAAHLRANDIHVGPAMTMEEALDELRVRNPGVARELQPLIALYEAERFSPVQDRKRVATIRRRLSELRA